MSDFTLNELRAKVAQDKEALGLAAAKKRREQETEREIFEVTKDAPCPNCGGTNNCYTVSYEWVSCFGDKQDPAWIKIGVNPDRSNLLILESFAQLRLRVLREDPFATDDLQEDYRGYILKHATGSKDFFKERKSRNQSVKQVKTIHQAASLNVAEPITAKVIAKAKAPRIITPRKKLHPDFIEQVKQRADIVEVISSYVALKKAGKDFLGCCPFHNESTPSFTVTPHKRLSYCFGCSWGGNAIKFLMELNRVSFVDAVLDLARAANIPVKYEDGSTEYDYPDPLPRPLTPLAPVAKEEAAPTKDYTVDEWRVNRSVERLLSGTGDAVKALAWLERRGISHEIVKRYRLGLEKRLVTPDRSKPDCKEEYSSIAIFIPVPNRPGRFYVKKRVAPWLTGDERLEYLAKWVQFGVPATIWFSHNPPDAQETWFTEGEWDAILLGELARQRGERVAVACSTSGAGTVPKPEQLERLPGQVTIFYDRDQAGENGARKLAAALSNRATIGSVPMPNDCQVKGWDVTDAILAGYGWEDFEAADLTEPEPNIETTPPNERGISFKVLRKSLDGLLEVFPELETEPGRDWLKMRKFTPDRVIDAQYFDWASDQPGTHLAVRSGLGTGKTYHVHNKFLADDNVGANAFGYRNSLLIQFTERGKNWYHLQQDLKESKDDLLLVADPNSRVASCVDSLIYFQPQHFENKRLVLDEIEGTFKHLYQSKTAVSFHRQVCKERMGQAIANSEAVIILDGNLTDLTVAHAERISGKKFTKVENLYKENRGKVTYYTGTLKLGKDEETGETTVAERRINDYSLLHKMMIDDPEPFICGSDSQEKLEAWHQILSLKGRRVFRLDGSNSSSPEAKKFLANPTAYIYTNKIDVVLYSPTAESGLSIDADTKLKLKEWFIGVETEIKTESEEVLQVSIKDYFKRGYFFFTGVVQTNEQTQFLARLRDPNTHIHVFCQNRGIDSGKLEQTSTHIQEAFIDYALACSQISLSDVSESERQRLIAEQAVKLVQRSSDPHFQYECHLKSREVFERNHLRKCLEYALHTAGYQVEVVAGFKVSQKELEAAQEALQVRKSREIFQAKPLTEEEANDKARKFDATQQDKTEVTRHRLISRLPGIENKTCTVSRVVTLLQSSVEEIKSGRVSLETAQKLGISTPETPDAQAIEVGHLPLNFSINQGDGVTTSGEENVNRNGGVPTSEGADFSQNQTVQNQQVSTPETPNTQAIEVGHLPLNFSINQGDGVPTPEGGEVEVVITETKPIFDPEFIRKVKYQDRAWLSKVELHFLVRHPEIAKLLQQRRWYKKLQVFSDPNEPDCVKRLNLTTYKSDWLKVHTLLEMGIAYFLNPESQWSQDTPEAVEFWEKGKDARRSRYIGITVGESNPCEFVGRVLDKLDVKRKCERVKNDAGEKVRVYRVDTDYLSSPMRSAVYECVQQRIESTIKTDSLVLNWDAIVENSWANEAVQKVEGLMPETPSTQALEVGHLPQDSLNNQGDGVPVLAADPVAELIETLPYCDTPETFAVVVERYSREVVEDAIVFQDLSTRSQLRHWLEALSKVPDDTAASLPLSEKPSIEVAETTSERPPLTAYQPGETVWAYFPQSQDKWLRATVEWVRDNMVRVVSGYFGMHIERPDLIAPGDWLLS